MSQLDARKLFFLACCEAYRDGVVEPTENQVLQQLMTSLGLEPRDATGIARRAAQEFRNGRLGEALPLDRDRIRLAAVRVAARDGTVDPTEQALLATLAEVLGPEPAAPPGDPEVLFLKESPAPEAGAHEAAGEPLVADALVQIPGLGSFTVIQALAGMGAGLVGAGVLFLVAANWALMPKLIKLLLVNGILVGAYAAGYEGCQRRDRAPRVGAALNVLGALFFGAGIWLVAQIFHLNSHFPTGFLAWGVGLAPLVYVTRSRTLLTLMLGLLAVWNGLEQVQPMHAVPWLAPILPASFRGLNLPFLPLFLGLALPALKRFGSPRTVALTALGAASWFFIPLLTFGPGGMVVAAYQFLLLALMALLGARAARRSGVADTSSTRRTEQLGARVALAYGWLLALTPLAHLLAWGLEEVMAAPLGAWMLPVGLQVATLAASLGYLWVQQDRKERLLARPMVVAAGMGLVAMAGAGFGRAEVGIQALAVALTFGWVYAGMLRRDPVMVRAGALPLVGWGAWTLLGWVSSLGSTGSALVLGGLLVLAGAFSLERLARELRAWENDSITNTTGGL